MRIPPTPRFVTQELPSPGTRDPLDCEHCLTYYLDCHRLSDCLTTTDCLTVTDYHRLSDCHRLSACLTVTDCLAV